MERGRNAMRARPNRLAGHALGQRGMALIYGLIVLVAMMLAGVALVRSVGTASRIAGNVGFRQDALATAERATQLAIDVLHARLVADPRALDRHDPSIGYYAAVDDSVDPTGQGSGSAARTRVDWGGTAGTAEEACTALPAHSDVRCEWRPYAGADGKGAVVVNGNAASYIVWRLCDGEGRFEPGMPGGPNCVTQAAGGTGEAKGSLNYEVCGAACPRGGSAHTPLYRIVVRTEGARGTVSYTETIVHF
jgi:type IV pilus assembly protein PilX